MSVGEMILSDQTYDFIVAQSDVAPKGRTPGCVLPLGNGYEVWYVRGGSGVGNGAQSGDSAGDGAWDGNGIGDGAWDGNGAGDGAWDGSDADGLAPSVQFDGYAAIPKCYGLLGNSALSESGILRLQNQPTLNLKGEGVLIGVIDTGIRYELNAFRGADNRTRIAAIWDQGGVPHGDGSEDETGKTETGKTSRTESLDTADHADREENPGSIVHETGNEDGAKSPKGFPYGIEYDRDTINRALSAENPFSIVPNMDENGHGTYLASIAGASADSETGFTGAAPYAEFLVVKLKPAKRYLKEYYFIPEGQPVFQENDIMAGIAYLERKASELGRPLVLFLGLGTNHGNHGGSDPLSEYLDRFAIRQGRVAVVAAGNEANMRHHFLGRMTSVDAAVHVEINVSKAMSGFCLELWAAAPEFFSAEVLSPTGERSLRTFPRSGMHQEYRFLFENTTLTIDYRSVGQSRRDQLILFRFEYVPAGIWTVVVYPENIVSGKVNLWLPMREMLGSDVFFLQPNPEITLTAPSAASTVITAGGYNSDNHTNYLDSGRGNTILNMQKPDFVAPAVEVDGIGLRGQLVTGSGTSAAAAVTAGACAQLLEWAVVRNDLQVNSVEMKNLLIRGCARTPDTVYPNNVTGYGRMDVFQAFEVIRNT